jgi:hypothetical protein
MTVPVQVVTYVTQQEFQHRRQIVRGHIKFLVVSEVYVLCQ